MQKIILLALFIATIPIQSMKKDNQKATTTDETTHNFEPIVGNSWHGFEAFEENLANPTDVFFDTIKCLPRDLKELALGHYEDECYLHKGEPPAKQLLFMADLYQDLASKRLPKDSTSDQK